VRPRRAPAAHRAPLAPGTTPISDLGYRQRARIAGRVRSMRVQPWSGVQTLECTVVDDSGALNVVFLGRRGVPGIELGTQLVAEGMVGRHNGQLAIINPGYELLSSARERSTAS
jgi:RecG-like helicase